MDGKKRIARLRNAEKWKKLGFGGFLRQWREERAASIKNDMQLLVVGLDPKPVKKKKRAWGDEQIYKAAKGFEWDWGSCTWIKTPIKGCFETAQGMIAALVKKGYKHLGSGHFSTVLGHPKSPDKVIKVTRHQDNWIDYVKWAAENGYAGTFGPKVYSWKKFPAGWSWAVVERMSHCVGESYDDFGYDSYATPTPTGSKGDDYEIIFTLLNAAGRGNLKAQVYVDDLCPGAFEYISKLKSVMRAGDIRAANTMIRKDGSLCFTDPCAGDSKVASTRFKERDFVPSVWRFNEGCFRYRSQ